jgi:hypothetical protein
MPKRVKVHEDSVTYYMKNGLKHGPYEKHNNNEYITCNYKNGKLHGYYYSCDSGVYEVIGDYDFIDTVECFYYNDKKYGHYLARYRVYRGDFDNYQEWVYINSKRQICNVHDFIGSQRDKLYKIICCMLVGFLSEVYNLNNYIAMDILDIVFEHLWENKNIRHKVYVL